MSSHFVLVTGLSGAGKSSVLNLLEDFGYDSVDNLPIALLTSLISHHQGSPRPLAVGVDLRTPDFDAPTILKIIGDVHGKIIFLDCDESILLRRFTTTRRRHPLAETSPEQGIALEQSRLLDIKTRADIIIDTTQYTLADLKQRLLSELPRARGSTLQIRVMSFSYARGIPPLADFVFDVRFLKNPHYEDDLQPHTGCEKKVQDYIKSDQSFQSFTENLKKMFSDLLPRLEAEGKSYLTIAFGCTGGKHRSVFLAEYFTAWLADQGKPVQKTHREI